MKGHFARDDRKTELVRPKVMTASTTTKVTRCFVPAFPIKITSLTHNHELFYRISVPVKSLITVTKAPDRLTSGTESLRLRKTAEDAQELAASLTHGPRPSP